MRLYTMTDNLTEGLSPSEISQGLRDETIRLCPYEEMNWLERDEILNKLLYEPFGGKYLRMALSILAVGLGFDSLPTVTWQVTAGTDDGTFAESSVQTMCICAKCPCQYSCGYGEESYYIPYP